MKNLKKPAAWQVRKIAYGLAAVVVGVLGWAGVLSEIHAEQIGEQVDSWLPILLAVLGLGTASAKTNAGSDSTATNADVAAARVDTEAVAEAVAVRLTAADAGGAHSAKESASRAESVSDYVASVRGE